MSLFPSTHNLAGWLSGRALGADVQFTSTSQDTRQLQPGALYIALQGEQFDGHQFMAQAAAAGAVAALVNQAWADQQTQFALPIIAVENTHAALGQFAARWAHEWRVRSGGKTIAITGSSGKTTVKELIASVLRAWVGEAQVLATLGNLNNDIGVPLTLLRLRDTHQFAVIEMGMNHLGEIAYLTELTQPDVALINNAQPVHLAGVGGDIAGVAQAKGEIYAGLGANGIAIINADDAYANYWASLNTDRRLLRFGEAQAEIRITQHTLKPLGSTLTFATPAGDLSVTLPLPGAHNVHNAAAATAAAIALGAPLAAITAGLLACEGAKGRLQQQPANFGGMLIDDTYNANPASMQAALDVLAALPGQRFFVMGDMGELGDDTLALHAKIGDYASRLPLAGLYCLGDFVAETVRAYGAHAVHAPSVDALIAALQPQLGTDSVVLVKGSRFMRMERVVAQLKGTY